MTMARRSPRTTTPAAPARPTTRHPTVPPAADPRSRRCRPAANDAVPDGGALARAGLPGLPPPLGPRAAVGPRAWRPRPFDPGRVVAERTGLGGGESECLRTSED